MIFAQTVSPTLEALPAVNATLNALATVFLLSGWIFIKNGNKKAHIACMISALIVSSIFLSCYLTYHSEVGRTEFTTPGWPAWIYFPILLTHIPLAALMVPVILVAVFFAARGQYDIHKKITRWLWPVWMYVSVTGVFIFVWLKIFPGHLVPILPS